MPAQPPIVLKDVLEPIRASKLNIEVMRPGEDTLKSLAQKDENTAPKSKVVDEFKKKLDKISQSPKLQNVINAFNDLTTCYSVLQHNRHNSTYQDNYLAHWQTYCDAMIKFIKYLDQQTKLFGSKKTHSLGQYLLYHILQRQRDFFSDLTYLPAEIKNEHLIAGELLLAAADSDVSGFRENLKRMQKFYESNTELMSALKASPASLNTLELSNTGRVETNAIAMNQLDRSTREIDDYLTSLTQQYHAVREQYAHYFETKRNLPIVRLFFRGKRKQYRCALNALRSRMLLQANAYAKRYETLAASYLKNGRHNAELEHNKTDPFAGLKLRTVVQGLDRLVKFSDDLAPPESLTTVAKLKASLQRTQESKSAIHKARDSVRYDIKKVAQDPQWLNSIDTKRRAFAYDLGMHALPESEQTEPLRPALVRMSTDIASDHQALLKNPITIKNIDEYYNALIERAPQHHKNVALFDALRHRQSAVNTLVSAHGYTLPENSWQNDETLQLETARAQLDASIDARFESSDTLFAQHPRQLQALYFYATPTQQTHCLSQLTQALFDCEKPALGTLNAYQAKQRLGQLEHLITIIPLIGGGVHVEKLAETLNTQLSLDAVKQYAISKPECFATVFDFLNAFDQASVTHSALRPFVESITSSITFIKSYVKHKIETHHETPIQENEAVLMAGILSAYDITALLPWFDLSALIDQRKQTLRIDSNNQWLWEHAWAIRDFLNLLPQALPTQAKQMRELFNSQLRVIDQIIQHAIDRNNFDALESCDTYCAKLFPDRRFRVEQHVTQTSHQFLGDRLLTTIESTLTQWQTLTALPDETTLDSLRKKCDQLCKDNLAGNPQYAERTILDSRQLMDVSHFVENYAYDYAAGTLDDARTAQLQTFHAFFQGNFNTQQMRASAQALLLVFENAKTRFEYDQTRNHFNTVPQEEALDSLTLTPRSRTKTRPPADELATTIINGFVLDNAENAQAAQQQLSDFKTNLLDIVETIVETQTVETLDGTALARAQYQLTVFAHIQKQLDTRHDLGLNHGHIDAMVTPVYEACTELAKQQTTYFAVRAIAPEAWKTAWGDNDTPGMLEAMDTLEAIKAGDSSRIALTKTEQATLDDLPKALRYLHTGKKPGLWQRLVHNKSETDLHKLLEIVSSVCSIADIREAYSAELTDTVELQQAFDPLIAIDSNYADTNNAQKKSDEVNLELDACIEAISEETYRQFSDILANEDKAPDFKLLLKRLHFLMRLRTEFASEQQKIRKFTGKWFIAVFNQRVQQDPEFQHAFISQLNFDEINLFYDCLSSKSLSAQDKADMQSKLGLEDAEFSDWCKQNVTEFNVELFAHMLKAALLRDMSEVAQGIPVNADLVNQRIHFILLHQDWFDESFAKSLDRILSTDNLSQQHNLGVLCPKSYKPYPNMTEALHRAIDSHLPEKPLNETYIPSGSAPLPSPKKQQRVETYADSPVGSPSKAKQCLFGRTQTPTATVEPLTFVPIEPVAPQNNTIPSGLSVMLGKS